MGLFGRGNGKSKIAGQAPEVAEIPSMIAERLASEHDQLVLSAILSISQESKKYRTSEVVDRLAEVLQYPHGEEVAQKAGDALVEKLKNGIHFEDAQLIITNRLGRRTEANAKLFLKMLDRLTFKPEIKRLAVEMLASFRGAELRPELVDEIEMALLQRMMDPKETEEVRKAIKDRFGKEGKGRPQVKIEESRGDEKTRALEGVSDAEPAKAKTSAAKEIPTASMDIVEGMLVQLREGNPLMKERAAMSLVRLTETYEKVKSRVQLEKIRVGVTQVKEEFPTLYRTVLKAMQNVLPDAPASRPPIAVSPSGEARRLGNKDPTPIVPVKTR